MPISAETKRMLDDVLKHKKIDVEAIRWIICGGRSIVGMAVTHNGMLRSDSQALAGTILALKDPKLLMTLKIEGPGREPQEHPILRNLEPCMDGVATFKVDAGSYYLDLSDSGKDYIRCVYVDFFMNTEEEVRNKFAPKIVAPSGLELPPGMRR